MYNSGNPLNQKFCDRAHDISYDVRFSSLRRDWSVLNEDLRRDQSLIATCESRARARLSIFSESSLISRSGVTSSPQTPLRIVSHTLPLSVSFASVVESHRVKIGKVQSARRRHWRDVKEMERGVEGGRRSGASKKGGKLRRVVVEDETRREKGDGKKRGREKQRGKYCFRAALRAAIAFDFTGRGNSRGTNLLCERS